MSPLSPTVGCGGGRKRKAAAPEMTSGAALDVRTANDRERERMRVQSRAFARLRTMLPWVPADTKLSKLHTLRLAVDYIRYLAEVLDEADGETTMVASPAHNSRMKTWPFICNSRLYHAPDDDEATPLTDDKITSSENTS